MGERAFAISAGDGVSNGDEVADGYAVAVADEDGRGWEWKWNLPWKLLFFVSCLIRPIGNCCL